MDGGKRGFAGMSSPAGGLRLPGGPVMRMKSGADGTVLRFLRMTA